MPVKRSQYLWFELSKQTSARILSLWNEIRFLPSLLSEIERAAAPKKSKLNLYGSSTRAHASSRAILKWLNKFLDRNKTYFSIICCATEKMEFALNNCRLRVISIIIAWCAYLNSFLWRSVSIGYVRLAEVGKYHQNIRGALKYIQTDEKICIFDKTYKSTKNLQARLELLLLLLM